MQLIYNSFLKFALYIIIFLVCYFLYLLFWVDIINSVIFLFELEQKKKNNQKNNLKISKIFSIWKIDVYRVLIINIVIQLVV